MPQTHAPKHGPRVPRAMNTLQTSFLAGIMRSKGYSADEGLAVVTELSTVNRFSDLTYDEARYLIRRLPKVDRALIDAYYKGTATKKEIGLAPFVRDYNSSKRKG
jgi:hypothetical protein